MPWVSCIDNCMQQENVTVRMRFTYLRLSPFSCIPHDELQSLAFLKRNEPVLREESTECQCKQSLLRRFEGKFRRQPASNLVIVDQKFPPSVKATQKPYPPSEVDERSHILIRPVVEKAWNLLTIQYDIIPTIVSTQGRRIYLHLNTDITWKEHLKMTKCFKGKG